MKFQRFCTHQIAYKLYTFISSTVSQKRCKSASFPCSSSRSPKNYRRRRGAGGGRWSEGRCALASPLSPPLCACSGVVLQPPPARTVRRRGGGADGGVLTQRANASGGPAPAEARPGAPLACALGCAVSTLTTDLTTEQ